MVVFFSHFMQSALNFERHESPRKLQQRLPEAQLLLTELKSRPENVEGENILPGFLIIFTAHPLEHCKYNFEDLDERSADPDIEDCEDGEDDGPENGEREDEEGGDESVDPELGLGEQDERQSPHGVKSMSRGWLGQDISEVELKRKYTLRYRMLRHLRQGELTSISTLIPSLSLAAMSKPLDKVSTQEGPLGLGTLGTFTFFSFFFFLSSLPSFSLPSSFFSSTSTSSLVSSFFSPSSDSRGVFPSVTSSLEPLVDIVAGM